MRHEKGWMAIENQPVKRTQEINNTRSAAKGDSQICKIAGRTPTECILINSSTTNPMGGPDTMQSISQVREFEMPTVKYNYGKYQ